MDTTPAPSGPRVSVCMAVYNGARWLTPQLESILGELRSDDEIVIVDDASTDDSVALIEALDDPRVRMVRHDANRGYVATFEHALSLATRDVILLSDQDDVWIRGRRDLLCAAVESADVAASDLVLLGDGAPLPHPLTRRPWRLGRSRRSDRIRRQLTIWAGVAPYFGCAMAVRREFLSTVLPFPTFLTESHDLWIATAANAAAALEHVHSPSVQRRLHEANASPSRPRGVRAVLRARVMLVRCSMEAVRRTRGQSRSRS